MMINTTQTPNNDLCWSLYALIARITSAISAAHQSQIQAAPQDPQIGVLPHRGHVRQRQRAARVGQREIHHEDHRRDGEDHHPKRIRIGKPASFQLTALPPCA